MKRLCIFVTLLLLAAALYSAQMWTQPVDVVNSTYSDYLGSNRFTELTDSMGNTYIFVREYLTDGNRVLLQKFSPTWQALWTEPLILSIKEPKHIIEASDGNVIFVASKPYSPMDDDNALYKINPQGQHLWSAQGIHIPNCYDMHEYCRLAPDDNGGAYIVYSHNIMASFGEWRYQQVNSTGNMVLNPDLMLLWLFESMTYPTINRLTDGKVIVTVSADDSSSVICMNSQNQILWRKNHAGYANIVVTSEGFIYTAYSEQDSLLVYKYDNNGNDMWTQPLILFAGFPSKTELELAPDESCVFIYNTSFPVSSELCKISSGGEVLWQRQVPFQNSSSINLVPDNQGGLFLYGDFEDYPYSKLWIQHINPQGQESTALMNEFPATIHADQLFYKYTGRLSGDQLRLIYSYNLDYQRGVNLQLVSSSGEYGYELPGLSLATGNGDKTAYQTLGKMGDKALVVWGSRDSTGNNYWLKYQIYNPDSSAIFDAPQLLNTSATGLKFVDIYEDANQGAQIAWLESNGNNNEAVMKLQVLSQEGIPLLEPGGLSLVSGSYTYYDASMSFKTGFWNNKLYLAYCNGGEIRLWCYANGISQWSPLGVLAANPDSVYPMANRLLHLDKNYLVWNIHRDTSVAIQNAKCTRFDEYGNLAPGYNLDGLPVAIVNEGDWGISASHATVWGDKLFVQLNHITTGVNNEGWLVYYDNPARQLIDMNGSYEWGVNGLSGTANAVTVASSTNLYGIRTYIGHIEFRKLAADGSYIWNHITSLPSSSVNNGNLDRIDDNNYVYSYNEAGYKACFGYFNAEGNITIPTDRQLCQYVAYPPTVQQVVANNSVYFLTAADGGRLCQLFRAARPSLAEDPATPANIPAVAIENIYPNPFNPTTTIQYRLKHSGKAKLDIHNLKGQKVRELDNQISTAGLHDIVWDGTDDHGKAVSSGIYFLRLVQDGHCDTRKLMLMK